MKIIKALVNDFSYKLDGQTEVRIVKEGTQVTDAVAARIGSMFYNIVSITDAPVKEEKTVVEKEVVVDTAEVSPVVEEKTSKKTKK